MALIFLIGLPWLLGLEKTLYPHLWHDLPVEPASIQVRCPHLRHLYLISNGSIFDSQWLHWGGSDGFQALLSVRLHLRHLWFTMYSASLAIGLATLPSIFNLSYALNTSSGPFTDFHEVLEHDSSILGVIHFWMELESESITSGVLHCLNFTRLASGCNRESIGDLDDLVIVALPDRLIVWSAGEYGASVSDERDGGGTELWFWGLA